MKWFKISEPVNTDQPFIKIVIAGNKALCLVNDDKKLSVLSARCPHAGGDLSKGWCADGKIFCPLHRYSFNLVTGKGSEGQFDFIEVYPFEARADGIYVGIETFFEKLKHIFN
jgi:3-phenylpropionate/trans-cinnamate dioxygenase ferredoxin subunit